MGGDYVPKCACCRDAISLWSGATLIEVSLMDALQCFFGESAGLTCSAVWMKIRAWIEQLI